MRRLGDLQGQTRPMKGAFAATLRGASPRCRAAAALSRQVLRKDGTIAPIVPSAGAWEQPAWEVHALSLMYSAKVERINREIDSASRRGGR